MVSVFLIGTTGYLGGAILVDLLKHFKEVQIIALVRKKNVDAVRALGVEVVEGQFSDAELITKHARTADITINAAGSDDIPLTNAILAGQKDRVDKDKKPPAALLHTSGVAVFAGNDRSGRHDPNIRLWSDGNEEDIRAIDDTMLHGPIDKLILRASEKGYTESYIVCPGAVVGPSTGSFPAVSTFPRFVTAAALVQTRAVYIGEGSNVFYMVYLDDLIDLYRRVFERILSRELAEKSPYTRYYLGTSNPLAWKEIATCFGKTLHSLGKIENAEPQSITVADIPKILYKMMNDGAEPQSATDLSELADNPAVVYFSASQNVRAERAKALGWKPRPVVLDPDDDWVDGIKAALRAFEAEAAAKA